MFYLWQTAFISEISTCFAYNYFETIKTDCYNMFYCNLLNCNEFFYTKYLNFANIQAFDLIFFDSLRSSGAPEFKLTQKPRQEAGCFAGYLDV